MKISILTLFPEMFHGPISESILKRAVAAEKVSIRLINLRDYTQDKYKSVDDRPYGGGQGMIMRIDVLDRAISEIIKNSGIGRNKTRIILTDPKGKRYTQAITRRLATRYEHLLLICGHYEGVDERISHLIDERISIGDYVLTGGEIPAMAIADSVVRLIPGVLHKPESSADESFSTPKLREYPQYTRPPVYKSWRVPETLLSGDHNRITKWKKSQTKDK